MADELQQHPTGLTEQAHERPAVLAAVNRIFRQALFCVTEEQLGRICLSAAKKLTGSKFGLICEVDLAGSIRTIAGNLPGWSSGELPPAETLPLRQDLADHTIPGRVIRSGESLILNDPASHPDGAEFSKGHPHITSFLGVPLKLAGLTFGMIALADRDDGYDRKNQEDVEALAVAVLEALMRKRAEWKLAELRQQHELILSSASEGILGLDLNGHITFVNPAAAAMLGYEVEELLGRNAHAVWHHTKTDGSPYPPAECPILQALRGGVRFPFEDDFFWRKDGSGFPVRCSRNPIIQNDQITGAVVTFRDITARKRAEEALAEEAIRRRILVEQSRDGIVVLDQTGKVYEANQRYAEMLGYSAEEVRQLYVWDWDAQWTREELLEQIRNINATGDHFETRHRRRDGTIFDVEISTNGAVLAGQKLVFCVCRDISQRKAAARALRQSEETYRQIVETALEGIWTIDGENRVTFANNRIMEMLGYSQDEVLGEPISKFMDREWLEKASSLIIENLREGVKEHLDFKLRHQDGRELWVIMTASPIFDVEGRYAGSLGMVTDITVRKQAEEGLRQSKEALEEQERFLASIFESIQDGISILDPELNVLRVNRAKERDHAYALPLVGKKCYEVFHGAKEPCDPCPVQRTLQTGKADQEVVTTRLSGKEGLRHLNLLTFPLINHASETITGVVEYARDITEQVQAEEALRESEQRFRDITENAVEWIWEVDPEGRYTYSSPVVEKLLGYTPEEVLGKHFYDFFLPEEREELKDAALAAFRAKQPFRDFLNRNLRKNGEIIWVSTSGSPRLDGGGNLLGYRGADNDITARKQAEESLRESEEKYRLLVNQIPAVVFKGYADWSIDFFDNKVEAITGYSKADFDSRKLKWQELVLPEDLEEAKGKFIKALKTDKSYVREYRIRRKDGGIRWIQNMGQIFCDASGKIDYVNGIFFDITARKQAEEALRQSEEEFRCTFDQSPIGAAMVGLDFRYQRVNAELCRLTGYSEEELFARTFMDITHPEDVTNSIEMAHRLAAGEIDHFAMEKRYFRKDGNTVWVRLSVRLIKDAAGRPLYYLPQMQDITAHKQADENLRQSLSRLQTVMGEIVQAMALTVEVRDPYTAGHQRRVTKLAQAIAQEMSLSPDQHDAIWCAGTLHDLGKIYVPEGILNRPGDLSALEHALIETHSLKGYEILKPIQFPWPVAQIVRQHHERLDGSGYPDGLRGEEILLEARILAVADVVEAMASHRPYREALGMAAALEEISRNRGILFDPQAVDACLKVFREKGFTFS